MKNEKIGLVGILNTRLVNCRKAMQASIKREQSLIKEVNRLKRLLKQPQKITGDKKW